MQQLKSDFDFIFIRFCSKSSQVGNARFWQTYLRDKLSLFHILMWLHIKNNIFYVNPLLNILGYSFYDIVYTIDSGEKKELRIFYKGELNIGGDKYKLYISNRNLNFLDKKKER